MSAIARAKAALKRYTLGRRDHCFGRYPFRVDHFVAMPEGLFGFRTCRDFALINPLEPRWAPYKLLQSLDFRELTFLVIELSDADVFIAGEDLEELACKAGLRVELANFLLIVSVRDKPDGLVATVNLRAPIVFDPKTGVARQCASNNSRYLVQQPIAGLLEAALGA